MGRSGLTISNRWGICKDCGGWKLLTKHSKIGHHRPPFIWICRLCHDKRHCIKPIQSRPHGKYAIGTKRCYK